VRGSPPIEDLLRESAPQVLAAVVRRFGDFSASEDAVQEALIAAAAQWPAQGTPESPAGWLVHVASRRMTDQIRSAAARRGRESQEAAEPAALEVAQERDDTLVLMFMCCHPALSPASAIALTLRAVAGLTTVEIAAAFLVPEATMAQRISRAKRSIKASPEPFRMAAAGEHGERLRSVLRVIYLIFNEGYVTSSGPELARAELSAEAIRLARIARLALPRDPEVAGLLALMLLTDARRPARSDAAGRLIPLAEQDRTLWDRDLLEEGQETLAEALAAGAVGRVPAAGGDCGGPRPRPAARGHRLARDRGPIRPVGEGDRQPDGRTQPGDRHGDGGGTGGRPLDARRARPRAGWPPPAARGASPPARAPR
jgi:RNA polymerase sigma factor (sigma-70 family)